jgi:hypothetical protein
LTQKTVILDRTLLFAFAKFTTRGKSLFLAAKINHKTILANGFVGLKVLDFT